MEIWLEDEQHLPDPLGSHLRPSGHAALPIDPPQGRLAYFPLHGSEEREVHERGSRLDTSTANHDQGTRSLCSSTP